MTGISEIRISLKNSSFSSLLVDEANNEREHKMVISTTRKNFFMT